MFNNKIPKTMKNRVMSGVGRGTVGRTVGGQFRMVRRSAQNMAVRNNGIRIRVGRNGSKISAMRRALERGGAQVAAQRDDNRMRARDL